MHTQTKARYDKVIIGFTSLIATPLIGPIVLKNTPFQINMKLLVPLFAALAMSGCIDGGGGNGSAPPAPNVSLTISSGNIDERIAKGDEIDVTVTGMWSGSKVDASNVFLQLHDKDGRFTSPPAVPPTANGFTLTSQTTPTLAAGTYTGELEVRACKDAGCTQLYAGASASVQYSLKVDPVGDWATMQRDSSHSGFVPIWLKPSKFAKAWEWKRSSCSNGCRINPVVTWNGKVYISTDVHFEEGIVYALNETDGKEVWKVSLGKVPALNPPAADAGQVFVAVTGHQDTYLWAFDATNGSFLRKSGFDGQWPNVLAPTIFGNSVFTNGGYYGGGIYAFSTTDGSFQWSATAGNNDMAAPAVDANYVYYHSGTSLEVRDRVAGNLLASIPDPNGSDTGYSYHGAPIIGGRGNVVAFSGDAFSGMGSSDVEQYEQRVISSFNITTKTFEWASSDTYLTTPALAKGVIFAARNNPMRLDAISETTGQVLWSWAPSGTGDQEFHRNIVVTRNLLFVSTDRAVYAIDLTTRQPVWTYPQPGRIALSSNRMLYIATGVRESDGRLIAIKLH